MSIPLPHANCQRIFTCIFEGITTRIYGTTFNLTCSPQYTKWFEQLRHNWSAILPKIDVDPVSSPRTAQSSQSSHSMPSPTTHVASNQTYFSNPLLMNESNSPALHLDARGVENHPHLRLSPPFHLPPSTQHQRPRTHKYASHPYPPTHSIAPLPPHDPHYFCVLTNSLSIKKIRNLSLLAHLALHLAAGIVA